MGGGREFPAAPNLCMRCGKPRRDEYGPVFCSASCDALWQDGDRYPKQARKQRYDPGRRGYRAPGRGFTWKQNLALAQIAASVLLFFIALASQEYMVVATQVAPIYWAWEWLRLSTRGGIEP